MSVCSFQKFYGSWSPTAVVDRHGRPQKETSHYVYVSHLLTVSDDMTTKVGLGMPKI